LPRGAAGAQLLVVGARPRRERLSGVDALTSSELRIARLAAEGRSNPQIAQALFVTRKTVETHLSNAYAKLDVAGRAGLASALASTDTQRDPDPR
jgi:DNA-binding CsgD family transcriptional regulator